MSGVLKFSERHGFVGRCTRCSQCKFVTTPKSQKHASSCPSMDFGEVHSYSASGQIVMGLGLDLGEFDYSDRLIEAVSSCTMCGACDTACKINFGESVEPLDSLYALRAKVVEDGQSPKGHKMVMTKLGKEGNSRGKKRQFRADWAKGLSDLMLDQKKVHCDVLIHIGSALSYEAKKYDTLKTIVTTLQKLGLDLGYLGVNEDSSGSKAFDLGYVPQAQRFATKFLAQVKESKAKTVVTFSSDALSAYKAVYPRFDLSFGEIRVLHISEYLCELAESGAIEFDQSNELAAQGVAYHDPCKLGRLCEPWQPRDVKVDSIMGGYHVSRDHEKVRFGNDGCYQAPRKLLSLLGAEVLELERNHGDSYCCGAKGGVKETVPKAAILAANNRLDEMDSLSTNKMVSGCGSCGSHLAAQARKRGINVFDLLDMVAAAIGDEKQFGNEAR